MKRSIAVVVAAVLLFAVACATVPPASKGVVTKVDTSSMTVAAAAGSEPVTYKLGFGTEVYWGNGLDAGKSYITTGQHVTVWSKNGVATKVVIEQ